MERREEGGLTEKEKARNEEESKVTESKRLFSKLVRQFYYRVIKKKGKKKVNELENVSRDISLRYVLRIY